MTHHHMPEYRSGQIINASLEIICEKGLNALSFENIAHRIGLSKGAIMHHYRNKQELVEQTFIGFLKYYMSKYKRFLGTTTNKAELLALIIESFMPESDSSALGAINISEMIENVPIALHEQQETILFTSLIAATFHNKGLDTVLNDILDEELKHLSSVFEYIQDKDIDQETHLKTARNFLSVIIGLRQFKLNKEGNLLNKEGNLIPILLKSFGIEP